MSTNEFDTEQFESSHNVRNTVAVATVGGLLFGAPVAAGILGFAAAYKGTEALVDRYQPGQKMDAALSTAKDRVVERFHRDSADEVAPLKSVKTDAA